jgi:hypothetical protein
LRWLGHRPAHESSIRATPHRSLPSRGGRLVGNAAPKPKARQRKTAMQRSPGASTLVPLSVPNPRIEAMNASSVTSLPVTSKRRPRVLAAVIAAWSCTGLKGRARMRNAITRIIAPATLALIFVSPGGALANDPKTARSCDSELTRCITSCDKISKKIQHYCQNECGTTFRTCNQAAGNPLAIGTYAVGRRHRVDKGDPKLPPKAPATQARLSSVHGQPSTSGGSASISRSSGKGH